MAHARRRAVARARLPARRASEPPPDTLAPPNRARVEAADLGEDLVRDLLLLIRVGSLTASQRIGSPYCTSPSGTPGASSCGP